MESTERRAPRAGVYVHIPFCSAICPYCDFAVTVGGRDRRRRLVAAVVGEVARVSARFPYRIDTVFFGGGTPSILRAEELDMIVRALGRHLRLVSKPRISLEANPEDVDARAVAGWRDLGVGTVSLGIQSLETRALRFLGRRHSPSQAREAVACAKQAGFETVSVDLIYARPEQTAAAWRDEIGEVATLEPDHVSCYQLTVHARTPFGRRRDRGRLAEMAGDDQADLFSLTHEILPALGWQSYEVSNFARELRHRSHHNRKYWTGAPYLGLGPSAHSYDPGRPHRHGTSDGPRRWWNVAAADDYLQRVEQGRSPIEAAESLSLAQQLLETAMLGLRTTAGIDLGDLGARAQADLLALNRDRLEVWRDTGLVEVEDGLLRATARGFAVADRLARELDLTPGDRAIA